MQGLISNKKFIAAVQEFMAIQAVTISTVRGLSKRKESLDTIRKYLGRRLQLKRLARLDGDDYARWLDAKTRVLWRRLPGGNKQWGVARKAMNLFMRQCLYNTYLSRKFRLARFQKQMEIPLDSRSAKGLSKDARKRAQSLDKWPDLKDLDRETSQKFQEYAKDMAARENLPARVFLDHYLWLKTPMLSIHRSALGSTSSIAPER